MKKLYKLCLLALVVLGTVYCVNMLKFAKGVKENAINKVNETNIQDSVKLNDSTYLYKKKVE